MMFVAKEMLCRTVLLVCLLLCHHHGITTGVSLAGEATEGESDAGDGRQEESDAHSLGDLSAFIIRRQDAEEGQENLQGDVIPGPDVDAEAVKDQVDPNTVKVLRDTTAHSGTDYRDSLCKKPRPPENGYLTGRDYDDGGVVHIHCNAGYRLQGPANLTCIPVPHPDAPGVWLPQDDYRCLPSHADTKTIPVDTSEYFSKSEESLCEKPKPPENGYIKGHNYDYEAVVYIFCEKGYRLTGPSNLTCLPVPYPNASGIWVPQDEYRCTRDKHNTIRIRTHEESTNIKGPSYSIVDQNGQNHVLGKGEEKSEDLNNDNKEEEEEDPVGEDVRCPKPAAPQHGSVEGRDYSMGATIRYACDEGYHLIGPHTASCLPVPDPFHHVAIWEPQETPRCEAGPRVILPMVLMPESFRQDEQQAQSPGFIRKEPEFVQNTAELEGLPSVCSLPRVIGPCREAIQRFFFDRDIMECFPFDFGGCLGNSNNFETYEECQSTCR